MEQKWATVRIDGPGQQILAATLYRLVALRATWLIHQLGRPPLTDLMLSARMRHSTAPPLWADKFPAAMLFSTSLSRLSSATRRFSVLFSCSSSSSRRA